MGLNPVEIVTSAISTLFGGGLQDIRTGFNFGYIFELVDTSLTGSIKGGRTMDAHVMVLNPVRYQLSEPFAAVLTPTEANHVVAEEYGHLIRRGVLEGTEGLKAKRVTGFGVQQAAAMATDPTAGAQLSGAASGTAHFLHLREMFRQYGKLKQGNSKGGGLIPNPGDLLTPEPADVAMVFHALREDDHFVVVPKTFETPRGPDSRVIYRYRIEFDIIATTDRTFDEDQGLFGLFDDVVGGINGAINDARAFFTEINAAVEEIKDRVRDIEGIFNNAANLINDIARVARGVRSFVPFTRTAANVIIQDLDRAADDLEHSLTFDPDPTGQLDGAARGIRQTAQALQAATMHSEIFGEDPSDFLQDVYAGEPALTTDDLQNNTAGAGVGSTTRIRSGTANLAGLNLGKFAGTIAIIIRKWHTLQGLATQYKVPLQAIVQLNNLVAPYIAVGGGPGVKKPGDTLLIPVRRLPTGQQSAVPATDSDGYLNPDDAIYGVDFAIDEAVLRQTGRFDFRVNTANGSQDASYQRGVNNALQGINVEINTPIGASAQLPEVGIRQPVGEKGTLQKVLQASIILREAILSDPRVEGLQKSTVLLEGNTLYQEIVPRLRTGLGSTVRIPLGTRSGKGV